MTTLHAAAQQADVDTLRRLLDEGADVNGKDDNGFTPLQRAATAGSEIEDHQRVVDAIELLIASGANLDDTIPGGRTALYLAIEFSQTVHPVQALLDAGASLEFEGRLDEYLIENANCDETQQLLMKLTGRPAPIVLPDPPSARLRKKDWAKAQVVLDQLFERLNTLGIVAEQKCGTTQEDAWSDCAEIFQERKDRGEQLTGICFYTEQDQKRAVRYAQLNLGIWGADEGGYRETVAVGNQVKEAAESLDLPVHWNGQSEYRPMLLLNRFRE
ncbi:ankyrin repeat domain-containing protein [Roseiconus nitratireducens]|uniref:Ankyrin repeat domain-containing protein n=1 Tax=Roseiconus nitratireducens TaxID=2605748 RepID=A0A5M6CUB8_9BACT|nr:ankyrin repeat domain-containing protein [Roseiconus nitratireducens]KAA5538653.1 ankyrin repeat domain-containing protein [Roseiconus nitratireducens]